MLIQRAKQINRRIILGSVLVAVTLLASLNYIVPKYRAEVERFRGEEAVMMGVNPAYVPETRSLRMRHMGVGQEQKYDSEL